MRPDGFQIAGADELAIKKLFGTEIINISTYTFSKMMKQIEDNEVKQDLERQKEIFKIREEDLKDIAGISRMYLTLKKNRTRKGNKSLCTRVLARIS